MTGRMLLRRLATVSLLALADGPLLDAAALPAGEWVSLEFALDQARTATFDPSRVGGFAVRLRFGQRCGRWRGGAGRRGNGHRS